MDHWAIRVRNACYEVTFEKTNKGKKYVQRCTPFHDWEDAKRRRNLGFETRKVGLTRLGNDQDRELEVATMTDSPRMCMTADR